MQQRPGIVRRMFTTTPMAMDPRRVVAERRYAELTSFLFGSTSYPAGLSALYPNQPVERLENSFPSYVYGGFKTNGAVAAVTLARLRVFSQLRFLFQELNQGRPGDMFDSQALLPIKQPWPGAGTRQLLARMLLFADFGGNAYVVREVTPDGVPVNRLAVLRPDWVTIVSEGDPDAPGANVAGYIYQPGGPGSPAEPIWYTADQVAHFAPIPDPIARWRGMSWLTPVVRNAQAHQTATEHKIGYFERGGTPPIIFKFDPMVAPETVSIFKDMFLTEHAGAEGSGKPLFLGGGADATVVGAKLGELSFAETQDAEEALIAAAAGVPLAIAQLGEGLTGSTLNAGNVDAVKRIFQESTIADLATAAAEALATIIRTPRSDVRLWWDARDIPFFRADAAAEAAVRAQDAATIRSLTDGGFDPETVRNAVVANDFTLLRHTGLLSVQLQEPGTGDAAATMPTDQEAPDD